MKQTRIYAVAGKDLKENISSFKVLGAVGILTNVELLLEMFGSGVSLEEMTRFLLSMDDEMTVFMSTFGSDANEILEHAHACTRLSDRVGMKVESSPEGFKAMRQLKEEGIKVIATTLFTYEQAYMAHAIDIYAISPFVARGNANNLNMYEMIQKTRELYDRYEYAPEILAASIRTLDDAKNAILAGADSLAASYSILEKMMSSSYSDAVNASWDETIK